MRNTYMTESTWPNEYDQNLVNMTKKLKTTNINNWHDQKFNKIYWQRWTLTCEYDQNQGLMPKQCQFNLILTCYLTIHNNISHLQSNLLKRS